MRHHTKTDTLSRFSSYRKATLKSLAISILINQRIVTTKRKAKSSRKLIENVITLGKKNTLAAKRRAFSILCDHKLVKKLFDDIAPLFANRAGGYTRIIPYRYQRGDNAQLVVLELTETYKEKKAPKPEKEEKEEKPSDAKEQKPEVVAKKEKLPKPKVEIKEKQEPKKEEAAKVEVKEEQEALKPEEQPLEKIKEEPKKPEEKKPKKFFGGFKGFFKKKDQS